jgi:hypothetical protein
VSFLAERRLQALVERKERAGDRVADGADLAAMSTAAYRRLDVEATEHLDGRERAERDLLIDFLGEVIVERLLIDDDVAAARSQVDSSHGTFASSDFNGVLHWELVRD